MTLHRFCHQLAKAGLWGMAILAVIGMVAGLVWGFCKLPKPIQLVLLFAAFGWGVWTWATYKPTPEAFVAPPGDLVAAEATPEPIVRRALPVNKPVVRRATLVNPHPKH
jgi:hypothetical protein